MLRLFTRSIPTLTVLFLLGFAWSGWNLWGTRDAALPGAYVAHGTWGNATMHLENNGVFTMVVHRKDVSGKMAEAQQVRGVWKVGERDYFWRDVTFEPFVGLAAWNRGNSYEYYPATFGPYWFHGPGFQVDRKASIFFRSSWRFW